ncbi:MAG: putative glycoside hydrolase, partial [bacterium]|nr:putative glycoside hydrolase [bacterium]
MPLAIGIAALAAIVFMGVVPAHWHVTTALPEALADAVLPDKKPAVSHVKTPDSLYGIYMTQCVVGTPSFRDSLVKFIDTTELNAAVIDIKDFSGGIAFPTNDPLLSPNVSKQCGADDMKDFVKTLHDKGIYVIGRITVFQDPTYTKTHPSEAVQSKSRPGEPWKDHKGLSFV